MAAWNGVTMTRTGDPGRCTDASECPFGPSYSRCVGVKREQIGKYSIAIKRSGTCHVLDEKRKPVPIDATWIIGHNCCFSQCRYKGSFEVFDPHITGFKPTVYTLPNAGGGEGGGAGGGADGDKFGGFTTWRDTKTTGWTTPIGKPCVPCNSNSCPSSPLCDTCGL